jgi:chitodextrinase
VAVVDANSGAVVTGLNPPLWTAGNESQKYQQAVLRVGSDVWQGGSEHNTHVYRDSDYAYLKGYVTANKGGDSQALTVNDGVVYQGSHGNAWIYEDATVWPTLTGYTRVDDYKWIGAFNASTREYEKSWVPSLQSGNTEGTWELHTDDEGCTWFGGDFVGGPYVNGQRQYLEGFSKFCQRDVQAPTVPSNAAVTLLTGGGVQMTWSQSSDDFPGYIGYEVLRNDRVISPLVYGTSYTDPVGTAADRYFVRAQDPAGNRSASTAVVQFGADNSPPTTPLDLAANVLPDNSIDLSWTASTDDVGVASYKVFRNGVEILLVAGVDTSVNIPGLGSGSHWLQVRAVDAAGNESYKTPPVRVDIAGADIQKPSVPGNPAATYAAGTGLFTFSWTASVDDTGVEGYRVRRNLVEVATVDGATLTVDLDLGPGGHYLQVEAFDLAGNTSYKTVPVYIEAAGVDTQAPRTPTNLTAVALPDGSIDVAWTAATDNVGVETYLVYRNGVLVATVPGADTTTNLALGTGNHYIQVRAVDAAGNESFKTPPVLVNVAAGGPGPDSSPPSSPQNVTAVAQPDGSILVGWTASSDNVGVTGYRIMRNLVEVATVDGTETSATVTGLGAGNHYMQVQALDAAGNESFRSPPVLVTL